MAGNSRYIAALLFGMCNLLGVVSMTSASTTSTRFHAETEKETLRFKVDFSFLSEPVPVDRRKDFVQYFRQTEFRDLLLTGGGQRSLQQVPRTEDLVKWWKEKAEAFFPELYPQPNDQLVSTTNAIHLPAFTILSTSCVAVRLKESLTGGLPEYDVLSIAGSTSAVGNRPLVWVFNKVIGNTGDPVKDSQLLPTNSQVRSRITIAEQDDGSYAVRFECKFQINIVFPKLLLRILPISKEKVEAKGSAACYKTVAEEVTRAVTTARELFINRVPVELSKS